MSQANSAADKERYFQTDHLKKGLRGRSVRGGAMTLGGQGGSFILGLASTAVLARLLTPEDFGLIAMTAIITGFVGLFKDLGLSMATVQREEVNHRQISNLFWVNAGLGLIIAAVICALSPLVAWFFSDMRLVGVTIAMSSSFAIQGFGVQHRALLRRQMRFGVTTLMELSASLVGPIVAIAAALMGAGYWSLVILIVSGTLVGNMIAWSVTRWIPALPNRGSGIRSMLGFGASVSGVNLMYYMASRLDNLLIGRAIGPEALGLYSKAYSLLLLPIQQIGRPVSNVAMPALSRLQNDPPTYRRYYSQTLLIIMGIGMPIVIFALVSADSVVLTVLGQQWVDSVDIFRWLAPAAFFATFNSATSWVFVSTGQVNRQLKWSFVSVSVTLIGFAVGINWGVIGVAASFSITRTLLIYPSFVYCYRTTPPTMMDFLAVAWRPAVASFTAGAVLAGWIQFSDITSIPILQLMINLTVFTVGYGATWLSVPGGRVTAVRTLRLLKELRPTSNKPRTLVDNAS
ncbi:MAG: lipopolysaccharide biosynthesis protein [Dehalococcoidia bacterium]